MNSIVLLRACGDTSHLGIRYTTGWRDVRTLLRWCMIPPEMAGPVWLHMSHSLNS